MIYVSLGEKEKEKEDITTAICLHLFRIQPNYTSDKEKFILNDQLYYHGQYRHWELSDPINVKGKLAADISEYTGQPHKQLSWRIDRESKYFSSNS